MEKLPEIPIDEIEKQALAEAKAYNSNLFKTKGEAHNTGFTRGAFWMLDKLMDAEERLHGGN